MKNNKGFTLIELLAVILILGIIALIAIPTVNGVIEESREGAAESSATQFVNAVERQIVSNQLDNDETNDINNQTYTVRELITEKGVEVSGTKPEDDGEVTIDDGKVVKMEIVINNYTVTLDGDIDTIKAEKVTSDSKETYTVYADGTAIYYNAETNTKCSASDINNSTYDTGTVSGCLRWYAYNDDSKNSKVKMILDHNIVSEYNYEGATEEIGTLMITELKNNYVKNKWSTNAQSSLYIMNIEDFNKILGRTDLKSGETYTTDLDELYLSQNGERSWLFEYTDNGSSWGATNESADIWGYWLDGYPKDVQDEGMLFSVYDGMLKTEQAATSMGNGIRPSLYLDKSILK